MIDQLHGSSTAMKIISHIGWRIEESGGKNNWLRDVITADDNKPWALEVFFTHDLNGIRPFGRLTQILRQYRDVVRGDAATKGSTRSSQSPSTTSDRYLAAHSIP
jgi:hypothetical protein